MPPAGPQALSDDLHGAQHPPMAIKVDGAPLFCRADSAELTVCGSSAQSQASRMRFSCKNGMPTVGLNRHQHSCSPRAITAWPSHCSSTACSRALYRPAGGRHRLQAGASTSKYTTGIQGYRPMKRWLVAKSWCCLHCPYHGPAHRKACMPHYGQRQPGARLWQTARAPKAPAAQLRTHHLGRGSKKCGCLRSARTSSRVTRHARTQRRRGWAHALRRRLGYHRSPGGGCPRRARGKILAWAAAATVVPRLRAGWGSHWRGRSSCITDSSLCML